ncbi:hypothetical protein J6590_072341 [Homalodisca vitripennis]|nr:hypothetical protein J6590_072341 [Homalodisca vitripennis]
MNQKSPHFYRVHSPPSSVEEWRCVGCRARARHACKTCLVNILSGIEGSGPESVSPDVEWQGLSSRLVCGNEPINVREPVLELMKEVAEDGDSSDISGYHSDSDSAIMMSGNSPYVTKRARHNFLTRSVTFDRERAVLLAGKMDPSILKEDWPGSATGGVVAPPVTVVPGQAVSRLALLTVARLCLRRCGSSTCHCSARTDSVKASFVDSGQALPPEVWELHQSLQCSACGGCLTTSHVSARTGSVKASFVDSGLTLPPELEPVRQRNQMYEYKSETSSGFWLPTTHTRNVPTDIRLIKHSIRRYHYNRYLLRSSSNRSGRTCLVLSTSTSGSTKSSDSPPNTDRGPEWEWKAGGVGSGVTCCPSCQSRAALQVLPPRERDEREIASLQVELETTRAELERTKARLELVSSKTPQQELSGPRLVRCYGNLYSQARVDALDALDTLPQLHEASELKSKILFSVVVLAFRSVSSLLTTKREQVTRILLNPAPLSSAHSDLEAAISTFLHRTVDTFDLTHSIEEVTSQLWATLYDYPCLKTCGGLLQYIRDSVRLAWALTNQALTWSGQVGICQNCSSKLTRDTCFWQFVPLMLLEHKDVLPLPVLTGELAFPFSSSCYPSFWLSEVIPIFNVTSRISRSKRKGPFWTLMASCGGHAKQALSLGPLLPNQQSGDASEAVHYHTAK